MSNRELRNEVKDLAYRTIRNKNSNGGSVEYSGISRNGIREVTINVDGSKVESVYPTEGTAVRRWDSDKGRWEKWTTNGWTEWENYQP